MFDLKAHLKALVECHAPSGHEGEARAIVRAAWADLVDETEQDGLGNFIGIRRATDPTDTPRRIMLAAHMDEIGMMVKDVLDGFILVHRIAGVDNRVMLAQPVVVHARDGKIPGVVASTPPHLLTDAMRARYPSFDELLIDVGLPRAQVEQRVRLGDLITVDVPMVDLLNGRVAGKAMDDRACLAAVTAALDTLQGMRHTWDVYAVATVQEEVGIRGAVTAAYHVQPDIAIALDVAFAPQPGVESHTAIEMGAGPALALGPNFHPKLADKIRDVARRYELRLQEEVVPGNSGTDAWQIQVAREGVPTALLSIALRNMHSPVETVELKDIERTGRLLAAFIASLDADFMAALAYPGLAAPARGN